MSSTDLAPVTELLQRWSDGERDALDRLLPIVYIDLQQIARKRLRSERINHTIQTSDLIHEAYLRMTKTTNMSWESRSRFFGFAAELMRQILIAMRCSSPIGISSYIAI